MATYFWRGLTAVGPTGYEWGNTANWRTSLTSSVPATVFPKGGDTVIFGATAIACCLVGGLSGGVWIGYNSGDADAATDMTVFVERGYGATLPNTTDLTQLGYSFGSITGGLNLKVNKLFIGTDKNNAEISINNIPASAYSIALMDGQTATFFASGEWSEIEVERGSLKTKSLTAENILIEGFQGIRGVTFFTAATAGFGVGKIEMNGPSNVGSVIFSAKATKEQAVVNIPTKSPITNAMGQTADGFTYTSVIQNLRPAGLEREYNKITRTLRYKRS
jgi:hypothetical protein